MTDRVEPPLVGDEFATLLGFLDYHRATLAMKCADLTPEQLARRAAPPSTMSLLGLVRHMTDVERGWFDRIAIGERRPGLFSTPERPDDDFDLAAADAGLVDEAFTSWREAIDYARGVAGSADLDATIEHERHGTMSVRFVLVHMVEEYARHNGHADLLREAIDGTTGE